MTQDHQGCVVMTTVDTAEAAATLSRRLVEERLAACVQRVPVESCYEWEGSLEEAKETLLMVKTTVERYPAVAAWLSQNHPYDLPEVVMVPAGEVSTGYLGWLVRMTTPPPGAALET
ncbi:MAG TPA: divalent-cation tolerance protein CutA [Anaerolineales bacterium]|nr:divalent-cation tolerance protein CutA [Anaerolineales bacterium]